MIINITRPCGLSQDYKQAIAMEEQMVSEVECVDGNPEGIIEWMLLTYYIHVYSTLIMYFF